MLCPYLESVWIVTSISLGLGTIGRLVDYIYWNFISAFWSAMTMPVSSHFEMITRERKTLCLQYTAARRDFRG